MADGISSGGNSGYIYEKVDDSTIRVYDESGKLRQEQFALDGARNEDGSVFFNYIRNFDTSGQILSESFTDIETGQITEIFATPEEHTEEI